ncbi:MAG: 3-isopropylmalate dehydratase large subunit [Thermoanaerobaculia bacterium]
MGFSFVQKILAKYAGKEKVEVGEIVTVEPDFILSHDNSSAIAKTFKKIGIERVKYPERIVIVLDHCTPAADSKYATNHKEVREFVQEQGIKNFYDINRGVCHQVFIEEGFAAPGRLILGSDSHTTSYGALGCFSAGIGRTEAASIWATGELWLMVPETLRIRLEGKLPKNTSAKDVILFLIGKLGADGALYKSVEFCGKIIDDMDLEDRIVLCNMSAEMGAKNGYCLPDQKALDYLKGRVKGEYELIFPDKDDGAEELSFDLSDLKPQIACPHSVDNVKEVSEVKGTKIHQVVIGTCTNGRFKDLKIAAEVLKGKKVSKNVRLLIFPASMEVFKKALKEGIIDILVEAGGIVMNPNCGPCLGAHEGALAPGEVCLSTSNRNFKGRMGCNESFIYLSSPYVAAISAIKGEIDYEI